METVPVPIALLSAFALVLGAAGPAGAQGTVPAEDLARIRAAAPEKAPAAPSRPRRLLVYNDCKGFVHSAIPHGAAALRVLGEKTGAFEAVAGSDPAVFRPESLARFDAVCLNNTTGELFDDPALKQSLLEFVRGGGGLVGIHAATDCFYAWPEFGALIGGYFAGHPWNEAVTIKADDPRHPLAAMFAGRPFTVADEIYQFKEPYSRRRLRVLLTLDTSRTDMNKSGLGRPDGDYAVSWVRNYGLGRVFYCSLGHREEIFWNPLVLQHYLAGIQFALGDLWADATPSAQLGAEGWIDLFNGQDLTGWIAKEGSWKVEDGVLARGGAGGDIWSEQTFGDFILDLEFRFSPGANSGVFFRVGDIRDCVQTGLEMQVLDSHGKPEPGLHDCGAVYDCLAPTRNMVRPAGEWNHATITCRGPRIRIVMNGEPIIDMDVDRWTEPHRNPDGSGNKYDRAVKDFPRCGRIGFQDYNNPIWYRNVRVRPLAD